MSISVIFLLAYFTSTLWLGFWIVSAIVRTKTIGSMDLLLHGLLGFGLGIGANSIIFFFLLLFRLPIEPLFFFLLNILTGGIILWAIKPEVKLLKLSQFSDKDLLISILFIVVLGLALNKFIYNVRVIPHGEWDAWAIWNLHARYLFAGSEYWMRVTDPGLLYSHPDYPLLTPAAIALGWYYVGSVKTNVPVLLAFSYMFGTVGLVAVSVIREKGLVHGLVASAILLMTPYFARMGSSQYADTPVGFYFLSGIVLLYLSLKQSNDGFLVLSGISVGLSAWTKNEGILYSLIFSLVIVLASMIKILKIRDAKLSISRFFLGLVPMLMVVVIYKFVIATGNDLTTGRNFQEILSKVTDLNRWNTILSMYTERLTVLNEGYLLIVYVISLLIFGFSGISKQLSIPLGIIILTLISYLFVYSLTTQDVVWHITFSLERLFMHILPSLIFCIWLTIKNDKSYNQATKNILGDDSQSLGHYGSK